MDPKEIHRQEQLETAYGQMAEGVWNYFQALIRRGWERGDAFLLTQQYQASLLAGSHQMDQLKFTLDWHAKHNAQGEDLT